MNRKQIDKETGEVMEERAGASATAQSRPVSSRPVSSRLTMDEAKSKAEAQFAEVTNQLDRIRLREVVSILVEVYMMPNNYTLIFNGLEVPLDMVKDVFEHLTAEMAVYALDRISGQAVKYSRRSLLRAMLYNEVFEHEGHLRADFEELAPLGKL